MRFFLMAGVLFSPLMLHGCSPTFNWREVRLEEAFLVALFPCKPERAARAVVLGAQAVTMTMLACDAGQTKFAVAYADTKHGASTAELVRQWKSVTLANVRAQSSRELPFLIKGASVSPQPVEVQANGVRPDGTAVALQAVWFAAGSMVYQAAVYTDAARANPDVARSYFEGLRLQ